MSIKMDIINRLLNSPEAIVRYVKNHTYKSKSTEKIPFDHNKQLRSIVSAQLNKRHPDGSIHATGEDGEYAAHSVSPFASNFFDNIEDEMIEVIKNLTQQGFLPISSCAGHSLGEERYVCLCFKNQAEIDLFVAQLLHLPYMRIETHKAEEFLNIDLDAQEEQVRIRKRNKKTHSKEKVTRYFQKMFFHHSTEWYVVRIEIVKKWNKEQDSLWSKIKRWHYKKYQMEEDTSKLAKHILSMRKYESFSEDYLTPSE